VMVLAMSDNPMLSASQNGLISECIPKIAHYEPERVVKSTNPRIQVSRPEPASEPDMPLSSITTTAPEKCSRSEQVATEERGTGARLAGAPEARGGYAPSEGSIKNIIGPSRWSVLQTLCGSFPELPL